MGIRFTEAELQEYNKRRGGFAPKTTEAPALASVKPRKPAQIKPQQAIGPRKPSKYRNRATGGYSSVRESRRAAELKLLEKSGAIRNLREQVPFVVIPKQGGERECRYVADFVYEESSTEGALIVYWRQVVEDVKSEGTRTAEYRIKRKLMLFVHGIRIREVM